MSIIYDSSVTNVNTPAAITGIIADRPSANTVEDGTVFISTDTQEIYSAQAGSWILVTTGGGGGSQNLDQVLAVGNTATNKNILLNGIPGTPPSVSMATGTEACTVNGRGISSSATGSGTFSTGFSIINVNNQNRINFRIASASFVGFLSEFICEQDINGKNQFFLRKDNGSSNDYRRFVVNASYTGGNTIELSSQESTNNLLSNCTTTAEINGLNPICKTTWEILDSSSNNNKVEIDGGACLIAFSNTNQSRGNVLQMSQTISGGTFHTLPDWNGIVAQVNEKIINGNIDLSGSNFNCTEYGVYVVTTGDNTNTFDLDNFVSGGTDGQFVTICVQDTPVKCANGIGNIYGTANINSNGLYKLMKIGNDIYSSHI